MHSLNRILGAIGAVALLMPPYSMGPADSLVAAFADCSILGGLIVAGVLQGMPGKGLTALCVL